MSQLNEIYMDMETLIRELSESLIDELALRDELEYEKELKNSFICLLLAVQHKRRQYHVEKKKSKTTKKNGKFWFIVMMRMVCFTKWSICSGWFIYASDFWSGSNFIRLVVVL